MQFRFSFVVGAVAVVSACAPQVPDSARGVGFDSVQAAQQRDAALQGGSVVTPVTVGPPLDGTDGSDPLSATLPPAGSAEATAAETTLILEQTRPAAEAGVTDRTGISNENNFGAVSEQRSIEGDAARLAQNKAQYQVVAPKALPERSGNEQPNIVAFALSTTHPVGTKVYSRAGFNGAARAERNCAKYPSPDQAQIDFLARGGPLRDGKGLDPDGDGFACSWDPSPFRQTGQG
ncbi:MAG: hypothetical protein ABJ360_05925 [Roseobacter sp.]